MHTTLAAVLGYLIGSVPFAYLLSRRHGIDLRAAGSGNVGATNVLRTVGVMPAILAMCLDAAKGCAAVLIAQRLAGGHGAAVAAGLGSIVGHVFPAWIGFRGGKGVATAAGVFSLLAPLALIVAAGAFLLTVIFTRYISLGSLAGSVTLAGMTLATPTPLPIQIGAVAAAVLIGVRHRGNVIRVLHGRERRIGVRA